MSYWTPARNAKLRQALKEAFDEASFDLLLTDYFGMGLADISPAGLGKDREYRIHEVLKKAKMEDWVLDLAAAARERRPKNALLAAFAAEFGMTVSGPRLIKTAPTPLEAIVNANAKFIKMKEFVERLGALQGQVCWIKIPGGGGTGFLIGPDLVLTNYHVMAPVIGKQVSAADVVCQFDYLEPVDGPKLSAKKLTEVKLHAEWDVDRQLTSDFDEDPDLGDPALSESDYALVRLAEETGNVPVGGETLDPQAPPRSWIPVPAEVPALAGGNVVFLLQHPLGEPLQLTVGQVSQFNNAGTRVRYDANSRRGSSGSPCFDADLQLVALHNGRDPNDPPKWNQAIPFGVIRRHWCGNADVAGRLGLTPCP
ncbi:MAG: trypsin-like peptidase domain-containing protein [Planctomycetaceae bacterium]|nr:trypsin-like peptidase domain-containing protein [Planctomycetaceae bacterium]